MPGLASLTPACHEPSVLTTLAVLVLLGVFPEVPDVAGLVLGVPIERVLDEVALRIRHRVPDDDSLHAQDRLCLVSDGDHSRSVSPSAFSR